MDSMKIIVQWATIISPIIAVLLARWTSRRGARDASKMIKSVKELTKVQIEVTKVQLSKELWDAKKRSDQASERKKNHDSFNFTNHYLIFYSQQAKVLQSCLNKLEKLSEKVE